MRRLVLLLTGLVLCGTALGCLNQRWNDDLHWRWAFWRDQAASYGYYLKTRPDGRHRYEAKLFYDERSWSVAKAADSMEAYRTYLRHNPRGKYVKLASARFEELGHERQVFLEFQRTGTRQAYLKFLSQYPGHELEPEALKALGRIKTKERLAFLTGVLFGGLNPRN